MLKRTRKGGFPSVLSRTLSRHGRNAPKRHLRPIALSLGGLGLVIGLFLLVPKPAPRLRSVEAGDDQLRAWVSASRLPPTVGRHAATRAAFGRLLFHAEGLGGPERRGCADCHNGGQPTARRARSDQPGPQLSLSPLSNADGLHWYGRDGRSDSLAAACLAALEEPAAMGSSRLAVLNAVQLRFKAAYEEAFGSWPSTLQSLPATGRPASPAYRLPIAIAAQGLATLGYFPMLEDILNQAAQQHATPALELSRRAFIQAQPPQDLVEHFKALSPEQQSAANQAFANVGLALAAFIDGLVPTDAPFDRYAGRLLQGQSAKEALGEGFGELELVGLKLFNGPGRCQSCHSGASFSDHEFHNIGLAQRGAAIDAGRASGLQRALGDAFNCKGPFLHQEAGAQTPVCQQLLGGSGSAPEAASELGAFKTPSLRNATERTRFMHDGRYTSLVQVLGYYNTLKDKPAIGSRDAALHPLDFTDEELQALALFLASLNAPIDDLSRTLSASAQP